MGNIPQHKCRSWDVHQVEYLMRSKSFGRNLAYITKICDLIYFREKYEIIWKFLSPDYRICVSDNAAAEIVRISWLTSWNFFTLLSDWSLSAFDEIVWHYSCLSFGNLQISPLHRTNFKSNEKKPAMNFMNMF